MSAPKTRGHTYMQCATCKKNGNPKDVKHLLIEPANHTPGKQLVHECTVCNPVQDDMQDE